MLIGEVTTVGVFVNQIKLPLNDLKELIREALKWATAMCKQAEIGYFLHRLSHVIVLLLGGRYGWTMGFLGRR